MMAKLIVCVSMLLVLLVALSQGNPLKMKMKATCCTQYHESPVPLRRLSYYIQQDITQNCNIYAIIFMTVRNKVVCANPETEWVQRAIEVTPE
uniref:Chemokine interleukin-8-like domain-containing protein n=2 Tax=Anabas testudineus TaxID=64144 RepID=A0A3Q1IJ91_ANATE